MVNFLLIVLVMFVVFSLGFVVGAVSNYAYYQDRIQITDQKETTKIEDEPKYGFAAKL